MRYKILIATASGAVLLTTGAYAYHFYIKLGYSISSETDKWGQFGDYFGGMLNPLLSFIALLCLIQSLNLQNQANQDLRTEIRNTKQHEKFRSFNLLFFNVIDAQKSQISNLSIRSDANEDSHKIYGTEAILQLEEKIEALREGGASNEDIAEYLEEVDYKDCVWGTLRSFYLAVKLVTDRLSDTEGFSLTDRKSHFQTLVNFTDFSQLRLILIAAQFTTGPYANFLTTHSELNDTLKEIGLEFNLY
ncbi:hypothetical protein A9G00_38285 [Achromobacter xylosoxidans]|nr:hypothetical protein A7P23_17205 [Achromobacter xylosoxidans]ODA17669.1 hypothetical protein A9G00_38285 [Achromobacter xylosoxidans]